MLKEFLPSQKSPYRRFLKEDPARLLEEGGKGLFFGWEEEEPKGAAAVFGAGHTAFLQEIYLTENMRGRGIGREFLLELMFVLAEKGFETLSFRFCPALSKELCGVTKSLGIRTEENGESYFTLGFEELSELKKIETEGTGIKSLKEASDSEWRSLFDGIRDCQEAPLIHPLLSKELDPELSFLHETKGEADGGVLVDRCNEELYLSFLWVDSENTMLSTRLLAAALHKAEELCKKDTKVLVASASRKMTDFIHRLTRKEGETVFEAEADLEVLLDYYEEEEG